jgi:hypothetical protein
MSTREQEARSWLSKLVGKPCWDVNPFSSHPSLGFHFGRKNRRLKPLPGLKEGTITKQFEGDLHLIAWCSWRLDGPEDAIASSDQQEDSIERNAIQLQDRIVESVGVRGPALDAWIGFSGGYALNLFCDHVRGDASIETNWELWEGNRGLIIGPGYASAIHVPMHDDDTEKGPGSA